MYSFLKGKRDGRNLGRFLSIRPQSLVSARVVLTGVSSTFSDVVVVGEPVRAYVAAAPTSIQIDGAFGDWVGRIDSDNDSDPVANPNINMTAVGSVNTTEYAAFFVSVQGQVFHGTYVPAMRGKPISQGGGGGQVAPRRNTGEDVLRIYMDSDFLNSTGELIERSGKVVGADYLLEIKGVNGAVGFTDTEEVQPWSMDSRDHDNYSSGRLAAD